MRNRMSSRHRGRFLLLAWLVGALAVWGGFPAGALAAVPLRPPGPGTPQGAPAARLVHVPILMYHYIRVNPNPHDKVGADLSVPPDRFAIEMQLLMQNGYHTISVA